MDSKLAPCYNETILRAVLDYSLKTMCKMRERKAVSVLSKIQVENNHEESLVHLLRVGQLPIELTPMRCKEIQFEQKVLWGHSFIDRAPYFSCLAKSLF